MQDLFSLPSHLESLSVLDSSFDGSGVGRKVVTHVWLVSAHEFDVESRRRNKNEMVDSVCMRANTPVAAFDGWGATV